MEAIPDTNMRINLLKLFVVRHSCIRGMKIFFSLMISCFIALSSFAQYSNVILKVNGNKNRKVVVDGRTYTMSNTNAKANNKNITITNLQPGQHTIQVIRTNKQTNTTITSFTLRSGYDVTLTVNGTGAVLIKEKQNTAVSNTGGVHAAMAAENFNTLLQDIQTQWQAGAKLDMINTAFTNTNNHFTVMQAGQLIRLIDAAGSRLQLAKTSYRSITDPANFSNIYSLLADQESRAELSAYVNNYNTSITAGSSAMNVADFNTLLQNIQAQWQAGTKYNMIRNAFANTGNYFTTLQARQLIQTVDAEDSRLQLAKASYRSIVDPLNFNNVFSLLGTQASWNELSAYINEYKTQGAATTGAHIAMNAPAFTVLLQNVQNQWQAATKLTAVTNAFNAGNYFTASQARQLIQTVDAESSRLQLAKAAYKSITDAANYNTVSDLLELQSSRNDLAAYIRNGGELNPVETGSVTMSDASFQLIVENVKEQWLPGAKMITLQEAFANTGNYFSTAQVRQLVAFVTTEANRLQLLKASYRNTTDRKNFSATYDLLTSQAGRDDLANYVNTYAG